MRCEEIERESQLSNAISVARRKMDSEALN